MKPFGELAMNVMLGADPDQERDRTCVWYPVAYNTVFPLLLETTDGHFFRLAHPIGSLKPADELTYLPEVFNPKNPSRAIDDIVNSLGDELDQKTKAALVARLEPFQRHLNAQAGRLTGMSMRIGDLERQLQQIKGTGSSAS